MLPCAGGAYSLPAQRQSFHYSLHCFAVLASCFAPKGIIIFRRLCCAATAVSVRARLLPCAALNPIHVETWFGCGVGLNGDVTLRWGCILFTSPASKFSLFSSLFCRLSILLCPQRHYYF